MRHLLLILVLCLAVGAQPPVGVLCFRGNATRIDYGSGPIPLNPKSAVESPCRGERRLGRHRLDQPAGRGPIWGSPEVIVGGATIWSVKYRAHIWSSP